MRRAPRASSRSTPCCKLIASAMPNATSMLCSAFSGSMAASTSLFHCFDPPCAITSTPRLSR
jgi:hypothetical protein